MTTSIVVQRARWSEIAPFASLAARERVNVTDTSQPTVWFKTTDRKGRVTGFAGVAPVSKTKARIRAVWVRPDFRGLGLGQELSRACQNYGIAAKFEEIEILSWDKRWAERNGFYDHGLTQHGAHRMIYPCGSPGFSP